METELIRLGPDNKAALKCLQCGTTRTVNAAKLDNPRGSLKARCKCGAAFHVIFEVRKAYRKETRLHGNYLKDSAGGEQGGIIVRNISRSGIGFTTLTRHNLKQGDKVKLKFTLDDKRRSEIEKTGVVKVVNDKSIGCQFTDSDYQDETLGFYLMP
ncbi:MAG: PilZ domain-containing protein [Syntrophobacterales bacterium]